MTDSKEKTSQQLRQRKAEGNTPMLDNDAESATDATDTEVTDNEAVKKSMLVNQQDKWKSWNTRFKWTWIMIFGFFFISWVGHTALLGLVVFVQFVVYKEILAIGGTWEKERSVKRGKVFRSLSWFWFFTGMFYCYGKILKDQILAHALLRNIVGPILEKHLFLSFSLYCAGFVMFVLSLRPKRYKTQFGQFAWCHMALLLGVLQSSFVVANLFKGMIWMFFPASLIVCNDVFAYVFGFFFGKTRLIKLSPKKTWEGFLGALGSTIVFSFFWANLFCRFESFVCPKPDFSLEYATCTPADLFVAVPYSLPAPLAFIFGMFGGDWSVVSIYPFQWHALLWAVFASLVGPFGGFFASGLKRAFKIKDFGDTIPGHGGLTDRFDCQILMGMFANVYINSFLLREHVTVGVLLSSVNYLSSAEQVELFNALKDVVTESTDIAVNSDCSAALLG